ncbi:hypothetical protein N473_04040 [Pseudoalteromonas luteoviolacea CPMOR-1]|uniref:Uncharacterized protein n=1 Tax=Pseudoalteromonas luteoviolacea CPMOR-1 TaxID=1365248 RepID=A0A161YEL7_9GAMM|nr:hypothetical protein [Pseudoalteromonas luteoviolacea]KZN58607.1 hypothetical protein N473_04040 [Pseudoalteromonas luteoviolacea CPMOR-1]
MRILSGFLLILSFNSFACELTAEYRSLRSEVTKQIREPYNSCIKSTRAHFYYKAVAKCKEEGRGENIGGGCYHIVGYEQTHDEKELEHCKILKPTIEQSKEHLKLVAKKKGIKKCSN